ncbi:hypothetical protein LF65_03226 [Clostridium beijerinckii]|uniref:YfjL-like N-terminal domain-containing protein n=1 Tax=Clostridium beijerinckii TaxID=1520 RepID=A0A0B5QNE9_CLOBE|nr:hypothetical protein [Clostridium beijerinckii]AJG99791.1 hypothetical protein LF65_03226 [Clostridium beijerinckii]
MRKRSILLSISIIIIIVLAFGGCIYMNINGLPWKIKETEVFTQNYLSKKYPDLKYKINRAYYNSKSGKYLCNVSTEEDTSVTFRVTMLNKDSGEDNYLESKVNLEAKNMVTSLIEENEPSIKIKQISVLEDAGANANSKSYDKYTSFIPGDSYPLKIDIRWESDEVSLEAFVDQVLRIRESLKNRDIAVCGLDVIDDTNNYGIDLSGREVNGKKEGNYNFTKDQIIDDKIAYEMEK